MQDNDGSAQTTPRRRPERSLRSRALAYLARREHSRVQLRRKLAPYAASADELERLLDQLRQSGLLSDARFAEVAERSRGGRFGAARVAQELRAHGVDDELVRATEARLKSSELARARAVWARRFGFAPAHAAERARQMRFLLQRGFAADVARRVVGGHEDD